MRYSPSPHIKQIADLKGKLISIGGINDITFIYIKPFLASAGLKTSDVDFIYAKAAGDRFSALVAGGVDATHAQSVRPISRRSRLGFSNLGDTEASRRGYPVHGLGRQHAPGPRRTAAALTAFARNYKRGVRWLYDPANKEQAIDILVKYAKQDRKDVERWPTTIRSPS